MAKTRDKVRKWIEEHTNVRYFLIALLLILCAFEIQAIAGEFRSTYEQGEAYVSYEHGKLVRQVAEPNDIQSWMTFSYIDFVFRLPPQYLQNALGISDPHYPNIQIRRYAKEEKIDQNELTERVRETVAAYQHQ